MGVLLREIGERCRQIYRQLDLGEDLPPSLRLRTEGLMEAAVLIGEAGEAEVEALLQQCHREVFERSLEETFGPDWREVYPFPQLPANAVRAPVYPSTA